MNKKTRPQLPACCHGEVLSTTHFLQTDKEDRPTCATQTGANFGQETASKCSNNKGLSSPSFCMGMQVLLLNLWSLVQFGRCGRHRGYAQFAAPFACTPFAVDDLRLA